MAPPNPDNQAGLPMVPAGAQGWDLLGNTTKAQYDAMQPLQPKAGAEDVGGHGTLVSGVLGALFQQRRGIPLPTPPTGPPAGPVGPRRPHGARPPSANWA